MSTNYLAARNSNLSTFNAININYSTLTGSTIIGSTLTMISTISVSTIYDSTITTRQMYYSTIIGSSITTSTITAQGISYSTLTGSTITTSTITAQGISYSTLTGSTLATTGVTANSVTVGSTITGSTLTLSGNASVSKAIVGTTSSITLNGNTPSGPLIVYESTGTIVASTMYAMSAAIVVCHGNNYGGSSILFTSTYNPGSDYGYITFIDNVANGSYTRYNYWNTSVAGTESAVLVIGCENDTSGISGPDSVIINPSGNIALDPKGGVTYITGNVGIGTTNPKSIFHIGTANPRITIGTTINYPITTSTYGPDIAVIKPSTDIYANGNIGTNGGTIVYGKRLTISAGDLDGAVFNSGTNCVMRAGDLYLSGGSYNNTGNDGTGLVTQYGGNVFIQTGTTGPSGSPTLYGGAITFATQTNMSSQTVAEVMRITANGNVGIGTTNPIVALDNAVGTMYVRPLNTTGAVLSFSGNNGAYGTIECFAPTATGVTSGTKLPLTLNAYGGNVGIGTTNPTVSLQVNGLTNLGGNVGIRVFTFTGTFPSAIGGSVAIPLPSGATNSNIIAIQGFTIGDNSTIIPWDFRGDSTWVVSYYISTNIYAVNSGSQTSSRGYKGYIITQS